MALRFLLITLACLVATTTWLPDFGGERGRGRAWSAVEIVTLAPTVLAPTVSAPTVSAPTASRAVTRPHATVARGPVATREVASAGAQATRGRGESAEKRGALCEDSPCSSALAERAAPPFDADRDGDCDGADHVVPPAASASGRGRAAGARALAARGAETGPGHEYRVRHGRPPTARV